MERSITDITLDLQRSFAPGEITVRRGDTHRTLRFHLADGGKPYKLTDVRAVLTAQKPDGTHIFNECTLAEDRIYYDLTAQTTACTGQVECQLRLYGAENALLHTAAFTLTVEETVYTEGDEAIVSGEEATALTKLIAQTEQKLSEADEALESIAPLRKTYKLIEEITLDEDVAQFYRTTDPKGVPYDFSAMRIRVQTAAASASAQIIFSAYGKGQSNSLIYHQVSNALATSAKSTNLVARSDHGFLECYSVSGNSGNLGNAQYRDGYLMKDWHNVINLRLTTYPSDVLIPAGTKIKIYAVRG